MNAFRKIRFAVLLGSLSVLALGTIAAPAKAGHGYCGSYGYSGPYCNYATTAFYGAYYRTAPCWPTYNYCVRPVSIPVTVYDCYGLPHVVYQTSYSTLLR